MADGRAQATKSAPKEKEPEVDSNRRSTGRRNADLSPKKEHRSGDQARVKIHPLEAPYERSTTGMHAERAPTRSSSEHTSLARLSAARRHDDEDSSQRRTSIRRRPPVSVVRSPDMSSSRPSSRPSAKDRDGTLKKESDRQDLRRSGGKDERRDDKERRDSRKDRSTEVRKDSSGENHRKSASRSGSGDRRHSHKNDNRVHISHSRTLSGEKANTLRPKAHDDRSDGSNSSAVLKKDHKPHSAPSVASAPPTLVAKSEGKERDAGESGKKKEDSQKVSAAAAPLEVKKESEIKVTEPKSPKNGKADVKIAAQGKIDETCAPMPISPPAQTAVIPASQPNSNPTPSPEPSVANGVPAPVASAASNGSISSVEVKAVAVSPRSPRSPHEKKQKSPRKEKKEKPTDSAPSSPKVEQSAQSPSSWFSPTASAASPAPASAISSLTSTPTASPSVPSASASTSMADAIDIYSNGPILSPASAPASAPVITTTHSSTSPRERERKEKSKKYSMKGIEAATPLVKSPSPLELPNSVRTGSGRAKTTDDLPTSVRAVTTLNDNHDKVPLKSPTGGSRSGKNFNFAERAAEEAAKEGKDAPVSPFPGVRLHTVIPADGLPVDEKRPSPIVSPKSPKPKDPAATGSTDTLRHKAEDEGRKGKERDPAEPPKKKEDKRLKGIKIEEHKLSLVELEKKLGTSAANGLSPKERAERLSKDGQNVNTPFPNRPKTDELRRDLDWHLVVCDTDYFFVLIDGKARGIVFHTANSCLTYRLLSGPESVNWVRITPLMRDAFNEHAKSNAFVKRADVLPEMVGTTLLLTDIDAFKAGRPRLKALCIEEREMKEWRSLSVVPPDPFAEETPALFFLFRAVTLCNESQPVSPASPLSKYTLKDSECTFQGEVAGGAWLHTFVDSVLLRDCASPAFVSDLRTQFPIVYTTASLSVHAGGAQGQFLLFTRGTPEAILKRCTRVFQGTKVEELTDKKREKWLRKASKQDRLGRELVCYAQKELVVEGTTHWDEKLTTAHTASELTLLGFVALEDDLSVNLPAAIQQLNSFNVKLLIASTRSTAFLRAWLEPLKMAPHFLDEPDLLKALTEEELKEAKFACGHLTPEARSELLKKLRDVGKHKITICAYGLEDGWPLRLGGTDSLLSLSSASYTAKVVADVVITDGAFPSLVGCLQAARKKPVAMSDIELLEGIGVTELPSKEACVLQ